MSSSEYESNAAIGKPLISVSRTAHIIVLIGFLLVAAGFFLSWGVLEHNVGFAAWDTDKLTGSNSGIFGYGSLALAVTGGIFTLISLFKKLNPVLAIWIVRVLCAFGLILLVMIIRLDPDWTALKGESFMLGYPTGPALAIIGFCFSLSASFFAVRRFNEQRP